MPATHINEALRLLRKSRDMELSDVAKKLNVSKSYVSRIENGHKTPNLEFINKYSEVLGVRPSFVLYFAEDLEKDTSVVGNFTKALLKLMKLMEKWGDLSE